MHLGRNTAWFSSLMITAVLLLGAATVAPAAEIEAEAANLIAPAAAAVQGTVRPISDLIFHARAVRELSAENAKLRLQVERLRAEVGTYREQRTALDAVVTLLGTTAHEADDLLAAQVLLRDPAPGESTLLVSRGAADGVVPGQPVLGSGGTLVGVVDAVARRRSWVRLITDPDSSVAVRVQSSRVPAALDGGRDQLTLEFVGRDAAVVAGDIVVTSALGGQLPAGLIAGRITQVHSRPQDLHAEVVVEPVSDLQRLESVLILTGFHPGLGDGSGGGTP